MTGLQKGIKAFAIVLAIGIIINIFTFLTFFVGIFDNSSNNRYSKEYTNNYQNIEELVIDAKRSNIVIKQGETFKVEVREYKNTITVNEENNKVTIKEKNGWFFNNYRSGEVVIYVPNELDSVDIDSGTGRLEISNLDTRKFSVNQGVGQLLISDSHFGNTIIDGGVGEINIKNSDLSNLELSSGVGQVKIRAKLNGNTTISSGVGEVLLQLIGNESEYRIKAEKGLGNIRVNNTELSDNQVYGNGFNYIDIDGGIGSININFEN